MRSGARGKSGYLRLGLERRGGRTILADLASRSPYLAQPRAALRRGDARLSRGSSRSRLPAACCRATGCISTSRSGDGARAHLTTQSATKVHAMDANYGFVTQTIALADGAYLEFLPDPLLLHRGARFASRTRITIAPTATLLLFGDRAARPQAPPCRTRASAVTLMALETSAARPDGRLLMSERLVARSASEPAAPDRRDGRLRHFRQRAAADAEGERRADRRARCRGGRSRARACAWRVQPAQRGRTDLQGARPRDGRGEGRGARLLGARARGGRGRPSRRPTSGGE